MPVWRRSSSSSLCLVFVALVLGTRSAGAQPAQRVVAADVDVAIPGALREIAPPSLPAGSRGTLVHLFTDGARPPLQVFVQTAPPQAEVLPARSDAAAAQFTRGFASATPGAFDVQTLRYEPEQGTVRAHFKVRAAAPAPAEPAPILSVECVAFLTKTATVLVLTSAPLARADAAAATASAILAQSRIQPEARLPAESPDTRAARLGRHIAVGLGGVLGALLWGFVASWALVWAGLGSRMAVAASGIFLVLLAGIAVFQTRGSLDALTVLGCYVSSSALLYVPLTRWLASRQGRAGKPSRVH
jgi:hypothetical protein